MDQYYDIETTKSKIDAIAAGQTAKEMQLANLSGNNISYKITPTNGRKQTWRLIHGVDADHAEEVVLRMQGVMCHKTLPPIKYPFQINPRQRTFLRQATTLSGLGSESFSRVVQSIQEIHGQFSRTFSDGCLEEWAPNQFEGHEAIDVANRFFTPRTQAKTEEILPFNHLVDPDEILTTAMRQDDQFTHTMDNEVEYYECIYDNESLIRYEAINPMKFRAGDIVEAQVSFICVSLKNNKFKMLLVLRALTILDTSPLREASILRNRTKNHIVTQVSIKRKVGYSDDEVAEARNRMTRMRLD